MVKVIPMVLFFTVRAGRVLRGAVSPRGEARDARGAWAWIQSLDGSLWGVRGGRGSWCELLEGGSSLGRSQRRRRALGWGRAEVLVWSWTTRGWSAAVPRRWVVPREGAGRGASRSDCAAGAGSVGSAAVSLSSRRTSVAPCERTAGRPGAAAAGTPKPLSLGP